MFRPRVSSLLYKLIVLLAETSSTIDIVYDVMLTCVSKSHSSRIDCKKLQDSIGRKVRQFLYLRSPARSIQCLA
jgi:hypothetical protein